MKNKHRKQQQKQNKQAQILHRPGDNKTIIVHHEGYVRLHSKSAKRAN